MSLYAIKSESGDLWDQSGDKPETTKIFRAWTDHRDAEGALTACYPGGHVVELVEKAEPVEVGKYTGELLTSLKEEVGHGLTTHSANYYVTKLKCQHDMSIGDIFRALDVGWMVKQPKRWYVKAPNNWLGNEIQGWLYKSAIGFIHIIGEDNRDRTSDEQFTAEEIEHYHLSGFEKVEVED